MHRGPLERLVEAARALPGEKRPMLAPVPVAGTGAAPPTRPGDLVGVKVLRAGVGQLLAELARRVDPALADALRRAESHWDQFDAVAILDDGLRGWAGALAAAAAALEAEADPVLRAAGREARLTIEAALGLVGLVERRHATLVRLRVRGDDQALLPGGRPFLDVAAALAEAARGWA